MTSDLKSKESVTVEAGLKKLQGGDVVKMIVSGENGRVDFEVNGKWEGGIENIEKRTYFFAVECCGCKGELFEIVE